MTFLIFIVSNLMFGQASEKVMNDNFLKLLNTNRAVYLVKFWNLNTNEIKEICIEDYDFIEAYEIEHKTSFKDSVKSNSQSYEWYFKAVDFIKSNNSRTFSFQNTKSIEILNSYYISDEDITEFKKAINMKLLLESIKNDENWFLDIDENNYKDKMKYAFILSQYGFQIGYFNECSGPIGLFCMNCISEKK